MKLRTAIFFALGFKLCCNSIITFQCAECSITLVDAPLELRNTEHLEVLTECGQNTLLIASPSNYDPYEISN